MTKILQKRIFFCMNTYCILWSEIFFLYMIKFLKFVFYLFACFRKKNSERFIFCIVLMFESNCVSKFVFFLSEILINKKLSLRKQDKKCILQKFNSLEVETENLLVFLDFLDDGLEVAD